MYVLLWPYATRASSIVNKLNIMSYNSACVELLRSVLFTLYIQSVRDPACQAGSWTTAPGSTVKVCFIGYVVWLYYNIVSLLFQCAYLQQLILFVQWSP